MTYDFIVIGGGPAGYVAAERAGAKGLRVLLIEESKLGGVCLNQGCIPSKTLLNSAKLYYHATHGEAYGVKVEHAYFDFTRAQQRKQQVMETLLRGVQGLMKKNKVEVIKGRGRLEPGPSVTVNGSRYTAANILIATGSSPARPPIPGLDGPRVVDSTALLEIESLPDRLAVIGGGVIGCEFACFFSSIGVPVCVIEMEPEICPAVDSEIAKLLRQALIKRGVEFHLAAKVESITDQQVQITTGDGLKTIDRDLVLVSTGRVPNVENLGLDQLGIDYDKRGIRINEHCATNVPGVWAAGDVTGKTWLAHAGSRMGEVVVHHLTGRPDRMRYHTIAGVIYTTPEVATVGWTEAEARDQGHAVQAAKMPMQTNGRFLAEHEGERGLVKVVLDKSSKTLLGVQMIGGNCSEIIYGAAAMLEAEWRVRELEDLVFPHPTTSELLRDTVLMGL